MYHLFKAIMNDKEIHEIALKYVDKKQSTA